MMELECVSAVHSACDDWVAMHYRLLHGCVKACSILSTQRQISSFVILCVLLSVNLFFVILSLFEALAFTIGLEVG